MNCLFNLEYLNTFLIATETGKLNQTAELTYRSHSAVSTQIKKLEEQVGTPLFIRNKNTLTLTKGGEILRNYAEQILSVNNEAFRSLTGKTWNGTLTIGLPPDYSSYFLSEMYPQLNAALHNYQLKIDFVRSRILRNKIHERKLDMGIVAMEPQYEDDIILWQEALHWACSPTFTYTENEPVPIALFSDDCVINNHSLYFLKKSNIDFEIVFTSISMDSVAECVHTGAAVALLPDSQITPDMKILPKSFLPCPFTLKMGYSWNSDTDKQLINLVLETLQDCIEKKSPVTF